VAPGFKDLGPMLARQCLIAGRIVPGIIMIVVVEE
jgi:hypothetical protein